MYQESGAAMTVDFYTITDDARVVHKTLPAASKHTITTVDIFKPSDLIHPRLVLGSFQNMTDKNYCYIAKFNRHYFINNVTVTSAQRVIMDLTVDVLYTYGDDIVKCTGTVLRSENPYTRLMYDNKLPLTGQMTVRSTLFPQTPFTASESWNYLMFVVGKEGV